MKILFIYDDNINAASAFAACRLLADQNKASLDVLNLALQHSPCFKSDNTSWQIILKNKNYLNYAKAVAHFLENKDFDLIVFELDGVKNVMTHVSCMTGFMAVVSLLGIEACENKLIYSRECFTRALAFDVKVNKTLLASLSSSLCKQGAYADFSCVKPEIVHYEDRADVGFSSVSRERSLDLGLKKAKKVIVLGLGVGSKENCQYILQSALKHGFEVAATRPVVLNAWLGMERQAGVSGVKLEADIVYVLGASGSSAFLYAIEDCKKVIAVNTDSKANIVNFADIFVKADAMAFVKSLLT